LRAGFWMRSTDPEQIKQRSNSLELRVRAVWERRYNQPSLNNPLFEGVGLYDHIEHLSSLNALEEEPEVEDDQMKRISELVEQGADPFQDIRAKLAQIHEDSVEGNAPDSEFGDISFD
jgi:hypothetical protein